MNPERGVQCDGGEKIVSSPSLQSKELRTYGPLVTSLALALMIVWLVVKIFLFGDSVISYYTPTILHFEDLMAASTHLQQTADTPQGEMGVDNIAAKHFLNANERFKELILEGWPKDNIHDVMDLLREGEQVEKALSKKDFRSVQQHLSVLVPLLAQHVVQHKKELFESKRNIKLLAMGIGVACLLIIVMGFASTLRLDDARKKITESEERYRSFFTSVEAVKLIVDPVTGAIKDANPAAVELYGYGQEQLQEMFLYDLDMLPKEELLNVLTKTIEQGKGHYCFRHRLASGDILDVEVYTSPVQFRGSQLAMYSIHDVTELRRLEQIKEDVERIVRHDLKAPLNGIINIPQLLLDDNNLTLEQRQMLSMIEASGKKMLRQVNSSLELYKIESGTYRPQALKCDPIKLVRDNIDILSKGMGIEPGLVIIREHAAMDGKNSIPFTTDGLLLDIILMNLLRNAVEASDEGAQVFVDLFEDSEEFTIAISNGRSVPVEIRETFFEKYTTAGKRGGTGLGTYSAALMTRAIGGKIEMETSNEAWTRVTVRIPMSA